MKSVLTHYNFAFSLVMLCFHLKWWPHRRWRLITSRDALQKVAVTFHIRLPRGRGDHPLQFQESWLWATTLKDVTQSEGTGQQEIKKDKNGSAEQKEGDVEEY